jgi:hypothetical protein
LNGDGTWNSREGSTGDGSDGGICCDSGGLVGFIGDHVEWFESLTGKDELPTYDSSGTTSNVWEAINDDAWVVDSRGMLTSPGASPDGAGLRKIDYEETLGEWGSFTWSEPWALTDWFKNHSGYYWGVAVGELVCTFYEIIHGGNLAERLDNIAYHLSASDEAINTLPSNFRGRIQSAAQLNSLRDELDSAVQELTETEKADYDAYVALCEDVPALMKSNPSSATSIAEAYLGEHLTDHTTPSKGSVLAVAMMAVDLASYRLNQQSSE